jgi:phage/plasmid-like protein (TIGR03299 family)
MTATFVPTGNRGYQLGTDVRSAATLDEALTAAGLNWGLKVVSGKSIALREEQPNGGFGAWVQSSIPGGRLVLRDDNWDVLGVVGGDYQGVNNAQSFAVAETLHQNLPGSRFSRAFDLDFGRRVFLKMDMPGSDIRVGDGLLDVLKVGIRFQTTHDGSGTIKGAVDISRLVCTNGMTVKIPGVGHEYKIRHTLNADQRLAEAHRIMAKSGEYVERFAQTARFLVSTPMSRQDFDSFVDDLYPMPDASIASRRELNAWADRRQQLGALFLRAETNESGRGTRWAAFNAVTEQADWGTRVLQGSASSPAEARALRQLDGVNQSVKDRAFLALAA